jgi:hypothetical protein
LSSGDDEEWSRSSPKSSPLSLSLSRESFGSSGALPLGDHTSSRKYLKEFFWSREASSLLNFFFFMDQNWVSDILLVSRRRRGFSFAGNRALISYKSC